MINEEEKKIDYIQKRIDILHKSFIRKMSVFTVVILNIYFTKMWEWYLDIVNKIINLINKVMVNLFEDTFLGDIFNKVGITELMSSLFYGVFIFIAIFTIIIGLYIVTRDLEDIKKLTNELKKYDDYYEIEVSSLENNKVFVYLNNFIDSYLKKRK